MNPHIPTPTALETAQALEKSIEHWNRHATGTAGHGEGIFCDNCALCALFLDADYTDESQACIGCPVYERTGRPMCELTPWERAATAWGIGDKGGKHPKHPVEFKSAAARMEKFLISLTDLTQSE